MKTIHYFILILVAICTSCDRSGIFEEFQSATTWELHLVVYSDDNMTVKVPGAEVLLYKSQDDLDNGVTPFLSGTTDSNGKIIYSLKDFDPGSDPQKAKGFYYLKASKDNVTVTDITRYLLMNDGHTYHNIVLK